MNLLTIKRQYDFSPIIEEYYNDFTKELDKYTILKSNDSDRENYITSKRSCCNNHILFRYPGFTTGYLVVNDDNTILDIVFHDTILKIYDDKVKEEVKRFIGSKIIFES